MNSSIISIINYDEKNKKMNETEFNELIKSIPLNNKNGLLNKKIIILCTQNSLSKTNQHFQHHFKDIKSPFATSVEAGKDQDNQAWGGKCCNYGKVGWTYIWEKAGGYCTFSTYITDTELIYDEVKWSD